MRILIVDSSILIIERLEEIIFEAENISVVHTAVSYKEAKKLLIENKYDAVVLDIDLPGNELLKIVKEIKKTSAQTCIIILFTQIEKYIQEQCKFLGVDFFFDKYYDFEKISDLLSSGLFIKTKEDLNKINAGT